MGKEIRLFKSEERKSREEVSNFLRQLADRISDGTVVLSQGTEELTLELPQQLVLEVEAEDKMKGAKGVQHNLEIEIKWFDNEPEGPLQLK